MKHLWEFCSVRKVNLHRKGDNFPSNRKNDRNIMEIFVNNGYHNHQLASINRCRIFLKVIHLSDITTGDGQYISRSAYNGKSERWSTPRYEWPNQGKPAKKDWVEWRRAINSSFFVSLLSLILPLSYQLNTWDEDISNERWSWWYSDEEDKLYMRLTDTLAQSYTTLHHRRRVVN